MLETTAVVILCSLIMYGIKAPMLPSLIPATKKAKPQLKSFT